MFYSDITSYSIILATAVTLNFAGITDINTAADAAKALRPLAGDFAYILFALGILGMGMIGVPVLAGAGAYGLAEAFGWKEGLELKATDARGPLLVSSNQRRCCGSFDGCDCAARFEEVRHGQAYSQSDSARPRLARDNNNGCRRPRHVPALGLSPPCIA